MVIKVWTYFESHPLPTDTPKYIIHWKLTQRGYTKMSSSLGVWDRCLMTRLLRPASVLVLVLYFWSSFQHCCAQQALCDMIGLMLKCNKHCIFSCAKCRNSAKRNWSSYHFLTFFAQSYFLITNMHVATEEFFCYVVLLLLNWPWS